MLGIQTSQNAKFYAQSASFDSFSNEGKTLVVQFTVKHEQKIDCGGGYLKVRYLYTFNNINCAFDGVNTYFVPIEQYIC